jgi:DNA-binding XRE family transcriptional regulator
MHSLVKREREQYARDCLMRRLHNPHMDKEWFKSRMKAAGVTQNDIALRLGRDRTIVTKILSGDVQMTIKHAQAFADILKLPLSEIIARSAGAIPEEGPSTADAASLAQRVLTEEQIAKAFRTMRKVLVRLPRDVTPEREEKVLLAAYRILVGNPDADLEKDILYYLADNSQPPQEPEPS